MIASLGLFAAKSAPFSPMRFVDVLTGLPVVLFVPLYGEQQAAQLVPEAVVPAAAIPAAG